VRFGTASQGDPRGSVDTWCVVIPIENNVLKLFVLQEFSLWKYKVTELGVEQSM
jgi:hypothetical protein